MRLGNVLGGWLATQLLLNAMAQYLVGSPGYEVQLQAETAQLETQVETAADVVAVLHPELLAPQFDSYSFDAPFAEDYRIGLLMDPCRNLSHDCCMGSYGKPFYEALVSKNGVPLEQTERVVQTLVLVSGDVQVNYRLVYADGSSVPESERRTADDDRLIDTSCTGPGEPSNSCYGKDYAFQPSELRPPCTGKPPTSPATPLTRSPDNNFSLNTLEGCFYPDGTRGSLCAQIGYTQNAYIVVCQGNQTACGTYVEVHQLGGTPYTLETTKLSEVQITQHSATGYFTTVLPLTWMGNASRVLCAYSESFLRVNSTVYVNSSAPVCCCPPAYSSASRLGSFACPYGPFGRGAFATRISSIAEALLVDGGVATYPYCNSGLDQGDRILCSVFDSANQWEFTRNCSNLTLSPNSTSASYSSADLKGTYPAVCPYFPNCGLLSNLTQSCGGDSEFSFVGRVGRVVAVDDVADPPTVTVTFNDGRTAYTFLQSEVQLERALSMYELWWVQRSRSGFTVQVRKGFNVTYPPCTFDGIHQRYSSRGLRSSDLMSPLWIGTSPSPSWTRLETPFRRPCDLGFGLD